MNFYNHDAGELDYKFEEGLWEFDEEPISSDIDRWGSRIIPVKTVQIIVPDSPDGDDHKTLKSTKTLSMSSFRTTMTKKTMTSKAGKSKARKPGIKQEQKRP